MYEKLGGPLLSKFLDWGRVPRNGGYFNNVLRRDVEAERSPSAVWKNFVGHVLIVAESENTDFFKPRKDSEGTKGTHSKGSQHKRLSEALSKGSQHKGLSEALCWRHRAE